MIGSKSFEIDAADLLKGVSTSDFVSDGGFSPTTQASNIWKTPGLLYGAPPTADITGDVTDNIIASSEDADRSLTSFNRLFVDDVGSLYTQASQTPTATLVKIGTDATNPTKYGKGITDIISYGSAGNAFVTNSVAILRWQTRTATITDAFYSFTNNFSPHPAIVYEDNAFYGDGNLLLRQTAVASAPTVIMTLPAEQTIVALGIDPGSGKMLISVFDGVANASATQKRTAKVLFYDGFSNKPSKTVIVNNMITAFYQLDAVVYVGYGQNLGYWTGAGIRFLRRLNVTLNGDKLPYKHNFSNIDSTLIVAEGAKILAYGDVLGRGQMVFYYIFTNTEAGVETDMTMLTHLGSGIIGYGWVNAAAAEKFAYVDTTSVASVGASLLFRFNKYTFARNVTLNGFIIEYGVAMPTNPATALGIFGFHDDTQQAIIIPANVSGVLNLTGQSNLYQVELTAPVTQTRSIRPFYTFSTQYPIRRITVFYTPRE